MNLTEEQKIKVVARFEKMVDTFSGHPEFINILLKMCEVHNDKSNDYASDESPFANIELCEKGGVSAWKGVIIRLGDKYSRLLNAMSGKLLKCEAVEDAFIDNACYSIIGLIEYLRFKKDNNEEEKVENKTS